MDFKKRSNSSLQRHCLDFKSDSVDFTVSDDDDACEFGDVSLLVQSGIHNGTSDVSTVLELRK